MARVKHDINWQIGVGHAVFVAQPSIEPTVPDGTTEAELTRHLRPAAPPHNRMRHEQVQPVIDALGSVWVADELKAERGDSLIMAHCLVQNDASLWRKHNVGVDETCWRIEN